MQRLTKANASNLTALLCFAVLSLLIVGCSPSDQPAQQGFEPQYVGGYPTAETAEVMFDEYDYQAAVQFYIWGYAYLNSLGWEKGCARMGGDERSIYH